MGDSSWAMVSYRLDRYAGSSYATLWKSSG
jgi:hypothetical protein